MGSELPWMVRERSYPPGGIRIPSALDSSRPTSSYKPEGWSRKVHSRSNRWATWAARAFTPKVSVA